MVSAMYVPRQSGNDVILAPASSYTTTAGASVCVTPEEKNTAPAIAISHGSKERPVSAMSWIIVPDKRPRHPPIRKTASKSPIGRGMLMLIIVAKILRNKYVGKYGTISKLLGLNRFAVTVGCPPTTPFASSKYTIGATINVMRAVIKYSLTGSGDRPFIQPTTPVMKMEILMKSAEDIPHTTASRLIIRTSRSVYPCENSTSALLNSSKAGSWPQR
mmetsp:Transcript_33395/g.42884  ORF Transcript_33395/g.42884 Transcript_33395/m.42884 type:complete len:217 (+) Transcript_33395:890-1540(+)